MNVATPNIIERTDMRNTPYICVYIKIHNKLIKLSRNDEIPAMNTMHRAPSTAWKGRSRGSTDLASPLTGDTEAKVLSVWWWSMKYSLASSSNASPAWSLTCVVYK